MHHSKSGHGIIYCDGCVSNKTITMRKRCMYIVYVVMCLNECVIRITRHRNTRKASSLTCLRTSSNTQLNYY